MTLGAGPRQRSPAPKNCPCTVNWACIEGGGDVLLLVVVLVGGEWAADTTELVEAVVVGVVVSVDDFDGVCCSSSCCWVHTSETAGRVGGVVDSTRVPAAATAVGCGFATTGATTDTPGEPCGVVLLLLVSLMVCCDC